MKLRKTLLAGVALAMMTGVPAQASIIDNPSFRVLGLVIVWGADASGNAPIVSDFVVGVGTGGTDLIADDVHTVVTGSLAPTLDAAANSGNAFEVTGAVTNGGATPVDANGFLDAAGSFDAFEIDDNTDVTLNDLVYESSFFVASNTAYDINATVTSKVETGDLTLSDIAFGLTATTTPGAEGIAFGANATAPGAAAFGSVPATLAGLDGSVVPVVDNAPQTASAPGSIASQSVRYDATYTLGGATGYDLSEGAGEVSAVVEYTVFVP